MQVPEHIVSLYIATCGQNGSGLGSDEKEIILLVYVVIDASTAQILGVKQILVRPIGNFDGKDRTISTSSETCSSITGSSSPPPSTLSLTLPLSHNSTTIIATQQNATGTTTGITATATTNATTTATANSPLLGEIPIININAQTANATQSIINSFNGPPTIAELPISIAQAAGKPLNEAIDEFDDYIRSLTLGMGFKLITDGQLPLRQCMHPEACAKDIELPTYYCKFSDLRKEYVKYKSGSDLSRALVPMKDVKKILQMPTMPVPQSIAEMAKELNILYDEDDSEFYIKESRDMVSVIQAMLKGGHQFYESEIINLTLEPGICSIDDEIDGGCIVRARGLPWQSSDQDIAKFFRGLNVAKGGVALCLSQLGRRNGEALVRFESQEHRDMALKRHKHHIGNRYIEVYRATGDDFLAIAGGASNEAQAFLSKGAQVIIRMRGLPYDCTAKQVLDFFTTGENPCDVLDGSDGVLFVKKPDGRATGDAFVLFALESDLTKALSRHRESIGQRYIELFRSTTAEVQQVLNRSMDPKTYEAIHQPPLIAQLPSVPLSLLPQHMITSGTTKNCIRLRGLPYEALVEHILQFLEDFAKNIIYQGVHMVINAQGQPSGEAFIQMDSEESARQCAQSRHNHLMIFRKKRRYIEVFQCSGDDMNMVLSGGLQSPIGTHGLNHHHHAANKQTSLISPGAGSLIGTPFGAFGPHFGPTAALIPSTHRGHHPGFYAQPLVYWPYPSPPVSPTTYYGSSHSTTHIAAAQHQSLFPVEFLTTSGSAVSPTAYQQSQTSPTALTPIHIQTAATSSLVSASQGAALKMTITPKQFHALASPHPTAATTALPNSMAVTNGGGHSLHYHHRHKLPLQLSPTPLSGGGGNGTCSSVYHQYPSPPPLLSQSQQHLLTVDTATTQLYHPTGAKSLIPTPYAVFSNSNNNSNNVNSNAIAISSSSSSSLSSLSSPPVQQGTISPTTSTAAAAGTTSAIKPNQFVELYIT